MRNIILFLLLSCFSACSAAEKYDFFQKEVEWGKPLDLGAYGGPAVDLAISAREMSYVTVVTLDQISSSNPTQLTVEKKNPVPLPGTNYSMYCVYNQSGSGLKVYFVDAVARQNHDLLVVAVPKAESSLSSPMQASGALLHAKVAIDWTELAKIVSWHNVLTQRRKGLNTADQQAVAAFNQAVGAYDRAIKALRPMILENIVKVDGYFRQNGIHVEAHFRTSPDKTTDNNWSHDGNINPITGKKGYLKD